MKRVLVVTPRSPLQGRGADEQDRLEGIKWFIRNGFETRVITKVLDSDLAHIDKAGQELGIKITPVKYKFLGRKDWLKRLWNPKYWDGAAYEYFEPEIQSVVKKEFEDFKPDIVWFDYTYLWPLYHLVDGSRIITRSINFEPVHFLDEDGWSPINLIRVLPKFVSEVVSFRKSDYFFAITPKEKGIYEKLGSTPVVTLPLRSLPERVVYQGKKPNLDGVIKIGFMASNYNVSHNLGALKFILDEILPKLSEDVLSKVELHFTGNKLPKDLEARLPKNVVYRGFVPSSIEFWSEVDIALVPSVFGSGMQQKVFEPLTLGVPTITSARALAGYSYKSGRDLLCAESAQEFAQAITKLVSDRGYGESLGRGARDVSRTMFNQGMIDELIRKGL